MAIRISGNGIDMGNNPVSNASQIDGVVINENNENVATTSNLVGFKNYIINGNFDIWQRGTSFSPISSTFFTADRWWLDWNGVASGLSASKQPGSVRDNSLCIQRTGGASMQVYQMVENQGNLSNKTFTFSALVRSPNNGTIYFRVGDGRAGTNFFYEQTPVTLEANIAKKIVFTLQLGQVSADALFVGIATTCTSLYIDAVQMEEGSVATPFEQRPIGLELSLCQRYYENTYSNGVGVGSASVLGAKFSQVGVANAAQGFTFIEPKRIPPTVTIYSPSGTLNCVWTNTDTNGGNVSAYNIGTKGVRYLNNTSANWTAPSYITFHYIADAEL